MSYSYTVGAGEVRTGGGTQPHSGNGEGSVPTPYPHLPRPYETPRPSRYLV